MKIDKKKIEKIFRDHLKLLNLVGYEVYVLKQGDKGWHKPQFDTFEVFTDVPYKRVILYIGEDVPTYRPSELRVALLHEATHVLLSPYTNLAEKRYVSREELANAEETLVDHIANTLYERMEKRRR